MPTYSFKCPNCKGHFDRILKLAVYDQPQLCECGTVAERQICAPAVRGDYAGYSCPVTGNWIEGRAAHAKNLKAHGCRVLEPGEKESAQRRLAADEANFERELDQTTDRLIAELPAVKREKLIGEIEGGIAATVIRQ